MMGAGRRGQAYHLRLLRGGGFWQTFAYSERTSLPGVGKNHVTGSPLESHFNRALGKEVRAGNNLGYVAKCASDKKLPLLGP